MAINLVLYCVRSSFRLKTNLNGNFTILFQVSLIYKDASLGNPVQIAVVRMLLLKDQEFVISSTSSSSGISSMNALLSDEAGRAESFESLDNRPGKSASEMLRNFCKWQRSFNDPDDSSPLHHDTALLLTRSFSAPFNMI